MNNKKLRTIAIAVILISAFIIFAVLLISGGEDNSAPTPERAQIGDDVIITIKPDGDCSGRVLVAANKEAQDEIVKLNIAKDDIGLGNMVMQGKAFLIPNCTKAKIIDQSYGVRQVRILEGDKLGESAWMPMEYLKK